MFDEQLQEGDRVQFNLGNSTAIGYGVVARVGKSGVIIRPESNVAPGVIFTNIKKVSDNA